MTDKLDMALEYIRAFASWSQPFGNRVYAKRTALSGQPANVYLVWPRVAAGARRAAVGAGEKRSNIYKKLKYSRAFVSWSQSFSGSVCSRRHALSYKSPHVRYGWLRAGLIHGKQELMDACAKEINRHADYLNVECIAYRDAIGKEKVNGYYLD